MVLNQIKPVVRSLVGIAVVGIAVVGFGGCVLSSPFDAQPGVAVSGSENFSKYAASMNQGESGNRLTSSIRGVSSSVASALTIEPKIVAASDPTSLNTQSPVAGADLHVQAAKVYEAQNNVAQALSHYESALLASPKDTTVLLAIARLHDRQGDWVRAESYYLRASDSDPQSAKVFNDLALCYARQSKPNAAISTLEFAIQLDPENKRYRNNLAAVLIEAGRTEEAYPHLASVYPAALAHYNVGYLLSKRGLLEPASDHLKQSLQADPTLTAAKQLLNSLGTGRTRATLASDRQSRGVDPSGSRTMRRLPPV